MAHIAIPVPSQLEKQDIEAEVSINGQRQALHCRVELFYREDCGFPTVDRADCLRHILSKYDQDWSLYYIGAPTDEFVPITFVKREDLIKQRPLLTGTN